MHCTNNFGQNRMYVNGGYANKMINHLTLERADLLWGRRRGTSQRIRTSSRRRTSSPRKISILNIFDHLVISVTRNKRISKLVRIAFKPPIESFDFGSSRSMSIWGTKSTRSMFKTKQACGPCWYGQYKINMWHIWHHKHGGKLNDVEELKTLRAQKREIPMRMSAMMKAAK